MKREDFVLAYKAQNVFAAHHTASKKEYKYLKDRQTKKKNFKHKNG